MKPVTSGGGEGSRFGWAVTRLLTSATVSRLADEAAGVAIVLFVISRTHDSRIAGLVVSAFAVPTLVSGPILGAYLDGLRAKKTLFVVNQLLLAGALTSILLAAGHVPAPLLIVFGLFAGVTAPVLTGGFSSLIPLLVPQRSLVRANAFDAASYNIAGLAGPALVAAIASTQGTGTALGAVAVIAVLGLVLVLCVPMPASQFHTPAVSLGAAVRDGLQHLWRNRLLRTATAATTIAQFSWGFLPVSLTLLAIQLGKSSAFGGWLLTAVSGGALLGALLSGIVLARHSPQVVIVAATIGVGLSFTAVALTPNFPLALLFASAAGLADGPVLAATLAIRQQFVPAHRYAQISATAASLKTGSYAIGAATVGLLSMIFSAREMLVVAGAIQLLAVLPMHQSRSRKPDRDLVE